MSTLNVATIKSLTASAPVFQNSSGVEKGQLAKAWVNFDGGGTLTFADPSGIRDSFNVTAVVDNGTGRYTVHIANDMSNINYVVVVSIENSTDNDNTSEGATLFARSTKTVGSFKIRTGNTESNQNKDYGGVSAVVFGD